MMGESQGSEKLPVGVDDLAAFTHDPFPLPPLCLITGTPRGKHRFFWATMSSQESLSFLLLPYIFFSTLGKPNPPIALAPLQFYNQKNLLSYAMSLMSPPRHCGFSHQLPSGSPSSPRAPQVPLTSVYRELPRFLAEPGTGLQGLKQCPGSLCLGDKVELHGHTCCHSWGQMGEYTAQSWSVWSLAELLSGLLFIPMVRLDRNVGPDL